MPGGASPGFALSARWPALEPEEHDGCDMLIGYARVSTSDQKLALQTDALEKAGCERIFSETASGVRTERVALAEALSLSSGPGLLARE
jgi:predicted site-specific integrase-resolvase